MKEIALDGVKVSDFPPDLIKQLQSASDLAKTHDISLVVLLRSTQRTRGKRPGGFMSNTDAETAQQMIVVAAELVEGLRENIDL